MQKFKKGDRVRVIKGAQKGKEGVILKMFPKSQKAQVEGVNVYKRHKKISEKAEKTTTDVILPIHVSNLGLIDTKAKNKVSKIRFGYDKNNNKVRVFKLSNSLIK